MGYTTDFEGSFTVTPPLTPEQTEYINAFNATRRMKRDAAITAARPDPIREAVGLPVGAEGGYFVGAPNGDGFSCRGQEHGAPGILDFNGPPTGQPGLWCQWIASEDGKLIEWDGGEKFYDYVEWLEYLVEHFLKPWGRAITGEVEWQGEDSNDRGVIYAKDNRIEPIVTRFTNKPPSWYAEEAE